MLKKIIFIFLLFPLLNSCNSDTNQLPDVLVDEVVYLATADIRLQAPGGWAYINGGIRGIIIYRLNNTEFKAYERSCPHISPNDCTFLDVDDSGIKVVCRCDKTEFLLITGEPLNGASHGLKTYNTFYDQSMDAVYIRN